MILMGETLGVLLGNYTKVWVKCLLPDNVLNVVQESLVHSLNPKLGEVDL